MHDVGRRQWHSVFIVLRPKSTSCLLKSKCKDILIQHTHTHFTHPTTTVKMVSLAMYDQERMNLDSRPNYQAEENRKNAFGD